jgi:hypothetical protein
MITREGSYDKLSFLLFVLAGTIILLWSALYNGYPLVYSDSGEYINDLCPVDRPSGYYLLILLTTMRSSLWLVVIYQAFFTSLLLFRNSYLLLRSDGLGKNISQLISITILSIVVIVTDISKYVSWVMPDIFTSWIFLGGILCLFSSKWYDRLLAITAISIAFLTHSSHILIIFSSLSILFVIGFIYRIKIPDIWKRSISLAYIVTLLTIFACVLNFSLGLGFTLSRNKGNFIISKLVCWGVLSKTLDACGPTKEWRFYKYKKDFDAAIGKEDSWFLWYEDSPIHKMGDWVWQDQREQNEIIHCALKNYFPDILKASLIDTVRLLNCFDSNDGLYSFASPQHYVYGAIKNKYPTEHEYFLKSRQQRGLLVNVRLISINEYIIQYGLIMIYIIASYFYLYNKEYKLSIILISLIIFIVLNGIILGSLSTVQGRYSGRVLWLIPFCLFLSLFSFLLKHLIRKTTRY